MDRIDVAIVGGGPAGTSLAWGLRDSGLGVAILDRQEFPRDKTCAGWITPQILEELSVDAEIYAKERVLQPIRGFAVRRIGARSARARFGHVVSYGIRRCEFDHFLLQRCEATLRLGEPLRTLEREGDGWCLNGGLLARLVVGAGGHFCPVARRLRPAGAQGEPIVAAQEVEFALSPEQRAACPVDPELPELFFTEDLRGYGWVFRKADYLNVGLGRQDRGRLSAHLERFLAFLRSEGVLPGDLPDAFHGHAYLLHGQGARPVVADAVALVGDAAGLAYPRSGEGIRPAVESGLLLARRLREAARSGAPLVSALEPYRCDLEGRLGLRTPPGGPGLVGLLPEAWARRAAGWLLGSRWFAKHVVVKRWFLHAHEAPLPSV